MVTSSLNFRGFEPAAAAGLSTLLTLQCISTGSAAGAVVGGLASAICVACNADQLFQKRPIIFSEITDEPKDKFVLCTEDRPTPTYCVTDEKYDQAFFKHIFRDGIVVAFKKSDFAYAAATALVTGAAMKICFNSIESDVQKGIAGLCLIFGIQKVSDLLHNYIRSGDFVDYENGILKNRTDLNRYIDEYNLKAIQEADQLRSQAMSS